MSLIGSGAFCHFIIKAKTQAVEIGPKMTSAFAHIVSEREEASKKGAYALCFKTRKILANLFRSFIAGSRFRSVDSKIAGLLRSLENNARDPGNLEFHFQYAKKALNLCLF